MSSNQKNILFKVESNKEIGTGHLMRCLTLANALRDSGNRVYFLLNDTDRSSINLIKKIGFSIIFLKNQKRNNMPILEDALLTKKIIEKNNLESSYLIIDNYKIDKKWERILRKTVKKIIGDTFLNTLNLSPLPQLIIGPTPITKIAGINTGITVELK